MAETASAAFEALSSILLMEPDAVDHDTMLSALLVNGTHCTAF